MVTLLRFLLGVALAAALAAQSYTRVPNLTYGTWRNAQNQLVPLLLDLYLPLNPQPGQPLIVWIHGGGWSAGSKANPPQLLLAQPARGYVVASIDYRLSGDGKWPAQIHDCKGAIRWLRANAATYGIDPDRIGVWGSSAGGHLVAFLGTAGGVGPTRIGSLVLDLEGDIGGNLDRTSRVQAVCDWFGPTDLLRMNEFPTFDHEAANSPESNLLGAPLQTVPERAASADPIGFVSADDAPFLIQHGTADTTVPFHQSVLLERALRTRGHGLLRFAPVQGAGHGGAGFNTPSVANEVQGFFDLWLRDLPATRVAIAAVDPLAAEGGDEAVLRITRTGPTEQPLTVRFALAGTATQGVDYAALGGVVAIPAGATTVDLRVRPLDDAAVEGDESVEAALAPDRAYRIDARQPAARATLQDDEPAAGLPVVTIAATDPAAAESGRDPGRFTIGRGTALPAPLHVAVAIRGSAAEGSDLPVLPRSVTIPANAVSVDLVVTPFDDAEREPTEIVVAALEAGAGYGIGGASAAHVTIADDDRVALPTVGLVANAPDASENGAGPGSFQVSRTGTSAAPLAVSYRVTGTATPGADYAALTGTATIPVGAAWVLVPVSVLPDTFAEGQETVDVEVLPSAGVQVGVERSARVTIADDDLPPAGPASLALVVDELLVGGRLGFGIAGARTGDLCALVAALAPGHLDLRGLGRLDLDPGSLVVLATFPADAAGGAAGSFALPLDPGLRGLGLWLQAVHLRATPAPGGGVSQSLQRLVL